MWPEIRKGGGVGRLIPIGSTAEELWGPLLTIGGSVEVASSVGPVGDDPGWCSPFRSSVEAPFPVGLWICWTCVWRARSVRPSVGELFLCGNTTRNKKKFA